MACSYNCESQVSLGCCERTWSGGAKILAEVVTCEAATLGNDERAILLDELFLFNAAICRLETVECITCFRC
jgi:hypothetical protein